MTRFMGLATLTFSIMALSSSSWTSCLAEHAPLAAAPAVPSTIQWHDNLLSGWKAARTSGRPMVIFITSSHCRYCDAMKQTTWIDSGIRGRIDRDFIAIRLTPENNASELSRVKVHLFPTTIVALPEGKVIDHREGFQPSANLHHLLNRVQSPAAK